jgi:NADH:quinone reductase (non-electrogenic)
MTFVVVGTGSTSVEMAGQIADLHRSLRDNFRSIDPADARIVLLDGADHLLGSFPESLQRRARQDLEELGVEVRLWHQVTGVDEDGVDTDSDDPQLSRIAARTKVWAAGVQGSPVGRLMVAATGAETDSSGRVKVEPDCTVLGHPEIFVV